MLFRRNDTDAFVGENSVLFEKSTSNQRIEALWLYLRKTKIDWWINYFKDMDSDGSWESSDMIHREALKFCSNEIVQKELDDFRVLYNTHRIRPYRNQHCPNGRPCFIYSVPEFYGSRNYKVSVSDKDATLAIPYTTSKKTFQCSEEFEELALQLMVNENLSFPADFQEARALYDTLLVLIEGI
ncbi:uncharacterized protein LOC130644886 isoform X2 [Hydractinia symbiolongicarpus]|uniref:uncharacterized protein LOC130644886 isoform X2 n=1 Tax=Hydractinia symbiolongicarpus TaxID=13093 RepID=UPI00254D0AB6|nr:uncharacterized protein LOC130644886 isoform X2 [Hydractinia symbiolongicarpus]